MNEVSNALSAGYMLADVTVRRWSARKTDKTASAQVTADNHARSDSARVIKDLMAGARDELKAVAAAQDSIRNYVRNSTLPWSATQGGKAMGSRLLPASTAFEFLADYKVMVKAYDSALADFIAVYGSRRAEAISNLGTLADDSDYPDVQDITDSFGVQLDMNPVPARDDYSRLTLPVEIINALGSRLAKQQQLQVDNAMRDMNGRILDELKRMAKQFSKFGRGEKNTPLYGTLISNMQNLTSLLRSSNLTNSEKIDELCEQLEALTQYDIKTIKANVTVAQDLAVKAEAVIGDLDEYFF